MTALKLRDDGGAPPLRAQVLWYPVVDHSSGLHASYVERGSGFGLTRDDVVPGSGISTSIRATLTIRTCRP